MDSLRGFLESSTIHGLVYISTERKFSKLFWILIVILGFSYSGYLIKGSLSNWSESPIKTTIETKPISELTFPKVSVCPPKNTFTDLNYDLMMVENKTLANETKNEFVDIIMSELHDPGYNEYLRLTDSLEEDNRAYNLYNGYSNYMSTFFKDKELSIGFSTSSSSGSVKTQYFGEEYDPDKITIDQALVYYFSIYIPPEARKNPDYTLTIDIDTINLNVSGNSYEEISLFNGSDIGFILDQGGVYNFTAHHGFLQLQLFRNVTKQDCENNKHLKSMPGFKATWKWNKVIDYPPDYIIMIHNTFNSELRRMINIIEISNQSIADIWHIVKKAKLQYLSQNFSVCDINNLPLSDLTLQVDYIEAKMGIDSDSMVKHSVENKTIETADKMVLFLFHCNSETADTIPVLQFFEDLAFRQDKDLSKYSKNLIESIERKVHDKEFQNIVENLRKFQDEKKFYNWYKGSESIKFPYRSQKYGLRVDIFTSASSGTVSTQYFGDSFDENKVEKMLYYYIKIYTPNVKNNTNYTLSIEINKVLMKVSETFSDSREMLVFGNTIIDDNDDWWIKEIKAPEDSYKIRFKRSVSQKDITNNQMLLDTMPGFSISWKYSNNFSDEYMRYNERSSVKVFRR